MVPVRGVCKKGHVVETVAPEGKLTWRGECPTAGCRCAVIARRIPPKERAPKAEPAAEPAPSTAPASGRRYKVVKGYRDAEQPTGFDEPPVDDGGRGRSEGPAGVGQPTVDDNPERPAGSDPDDDEHDAGEPERQRPGWRARRRARAAQQPYRVIDGIY
jgi:hypothetical protein